MHTIIRVLPLLSEKTSRCVLTPRLLIANMDRIIRVLPLLIFAPALLGAWL
jgi:hypothetical protein